MSTISIILPVHELNDTTKPLFNNAIESVKTQQLLPNELVIVVPKGSETASYIKNDFDFGNIKSMVKIIDNDGATDFATQFNLGVSKSSSEWVSLLEFDDEYANTWFKNADKYIKAHTDVEIFMPIVVDVNADGEFIGLTNEAVWAQSFSDELGILDNNALLAYQNFNVDGMVIKKSLIEAHGGFKSNVKLTFIYEFLLRMTFKSVKVMVIPRYGYKHVNQRPDSLFASYKEEMNPIEAKWWLAQAKKEYYFSKDRIITYQEETV